MPKKIHVVINPASGQPDEILNKLNAVFHEAGVHWDVSITHESGDATRLAREAIEAGADVVCACGGDGTVMEVAHVVKGDEVPMAILPGGTANLMAVELGVSKDLTQAAQIVASDDSTITMVDMGQVGERFFMLRLGMGVAAEKVRLADREMKDRYGIMAYSIAALKAIKDAQKVNYQIDIDGVHYEVQGLTCLVDNAGNLGTAGISAAKNISVNDGLLDVIIVRDAGFSSLISTVRSIADKGPDPESFYHWQGREISIQCNLPTSIQGDGEMWGESPVEIKVLPGVLPILTPG
ncbi:diacylglycerol/lipid kinase family protein [Chloroflexota bacterium]